MAVSFDTGLGKEFFKLSVFSQEEKKGKLPLEAQKRELAAALLHKQWVHKGGKHSFPG